MGIKTGSVSCTGLLLPPLGLTNLMTTLAGWGCIVHS